MKAKLFMISILTAALIFVFAGASWADSGKKRHRHAGSAKRIAWKHHANRFHHRPPHYKHKIKRHQKHFYKNRHYRKRPALRRYRHYKLHHRHRWIHRHRPVYRYDRYHSEYSDDGGSSYNEFSLAATISEPGVEFSIGTKRTW